MPDSDRDQLEKWVRSSSTKAGLVLRARIVLLAADGVAHAEIARRFSISRQTVINWRARYESGGVEGLFDEDRPGRPRTLDREQLISVTLAPPPRKYGVTHWSSRLLARHLGIGYGTVARVWRDHGIQPWRAETFKFSTDPELIAKVTDIVGLYLDPPENAVVLCVDEKSQIQALDRTAPTLPMQIGMPQRHTHDYVRNGTTTLFAALEIATGQVTGVCKPRHRHQEFLAFLKHLARAYPDQELRLVMDNYAAHKKQEVTDWLAGNPRIRVHFTPTSASWMNMVEIWFGIIERQAIHRGTFGSVRDLTTAIRTYINGWNIRAHPFVWTKTADEILKKANRQTTSNAGHWRIERVANHDRGDHCAPMRNVRSSASSTQPNTRIEPLRRQKPPTPCPPNRVKPRGHYRSSIHSRSVKFSNVTNTTGSSRRINADLLILARTAQPSPWRSCTTRFASASTPEIAATAAGTV